MDLGRVSPHLNNMTCILTKSTFFFYLTKWYAAPSLNHILHQTPINSDGKELRVVHETSIEEQKSIIWTQIAFFASFQQSAYRQSGPLCIGTPQFIIKPTSLAYCMLAGEIKKKTSMLTKFINLR